MNVTKVIAERVDKIFDKFRKIVESSDVRGGEFNAKIYGVFNYDLRNLQNVFTLYFDKAYVYPLFCNYLYRWGVTINQHIVHIIFSNYRHSHLLRWLVHCGYWINYHQSVDLYPRWFYFQMHHDMVWNQLLIDAGIDKTSLHEQLSRENLNRLDVCIRLGNEYHNFVIENTAIFAILIEM